MNNPSVFNSLKIRLLLNFLVMLVLIVAVTLYTVRSATYSHSTGQLLDHARTSQNVVKDKINNRGNTLQEALNTVSKDFSFKRLIVTGKDDKASLFVALQNYQRRNDADIAWILDDQLQIMASSLHQDLGAQTIQPESLQSGDLHLVSIAEQYYLVKAAPVKFVESSRNVNAWLLMGVDTRKLITSELVELTDMDISLLAIGSPNIIIGSTYSSEFNAALQQQTINNSDGLHQLNGQLSEYLYTITEFGQWQKMPLQLLLTTKEGKAYLSYNSLLIQLIGILAIAAFMALFAAMLLSRGITSPISQLVAVAQKIRNGKYVSSFPTSSTTEISSLSGAINEMQEGIRSREAEIQKLAYFDSLTQLPNRNHFNLHLEKQLTEHKDETLAVLMLDLDRFKDINDTVGHEIGDKLLQDIAKRLRNAAYQGVFIAHMGGDEFALVISQITTQKLETIAETFSALFERPFQVEQLTLDVDVSIGIAQYPSDADTVNGLLQCVDIAMYSCKGLHYPFAVYDPALNKHSVQRLSLMSELRGAVADGQLKLYYQPKLSIAENKIKTVECLVRWIHPVHGFIPPDEFIPLAEQTGAIRDVTHWVLKEAFSQQKQWRDLGDSGENMGIAINISAIDLVDMTLPTYVAELMSEYNLDSNMLTLEVTESAVMSEPESALKALNTLRCMGIALSIDDFGTGYSSMAQLKKMPVDELKIDKAFVLELAQNEDDRIMVRTLLSLAQNLGLSTVAEGVEDQESLNLLAQMGCTKAQGFYLSRPLPANDFMEWLQNYQPESREVIELHSQQEVS